ncbi:MAG: serine/threonine-protein kinase PknK, partial [Myxococcales bacterium]|nr:serine/threonine-protein kinase PknK [Myxococcales bacterium]
LGRLDGTGSLLAHELVGGDDPVLLLEDFPGWPLTRLLRERGAALDLPARLRIALQLTAALGQIHACSVVHNDVCPANVLVDPESLTTKLAGFTISSLLSRERPSIAAPETIEGSLAHISPERTGRMNRLVDYRSDYYSLGATLYELFTGRVPFDTADPMALVHSHIARIPEPPHRVEPSVPPQLSAIILKLLAKMAEDRYQSTFTIESLLRACLRAAQGEGAADDAAAADGVAAAERGDVAAQLQVSQKLYGRDREVQALLDAFERTRGRPGASAPGGHVELVLVAGYSGIGKSSLVNEIHKPIAREGGYFVEGKFDQFNRNIPYASLILALQQLVRQLLTERGDALARWRERLSAAVGANGQVIAEVIPEVELIIGKQPPVRALGPAESKNRFNLTFRDFISAFASPERPLVLFLDDLQWADRASMDLLALLLCDDQIQHVLLIGAYRDNEVDATHPLTLVLDRLREAEARVSTITLEALGADDVGQLLTDTLQCSPQRAAPLVGLLMRKTGGNPFFIIQVLHQIYERDLLSFDAARGRWTWSIEDIERIDITSNVVELMVGKLRALDPATQRVLTVAACVGNRFELDLLALATALSAPEAAERLWPALLAELVVPLDEGYKAAQVSTEPLDRSIRYEFLHDRVQQAAYELVDEPERRRIHVRLGQLLLEHRTPEQIDETLFDITMHLNHGLELIESPSLRSAAVELNHRAGRRARDASAHATGLECLRAAMALLPEDHWHQDYARSLALYRDRVELEYLNIHFEHAEAFADEVLRRAASVLDKIPVYETRIQF